MEINKIKSILDAIKNTDIEEIWIERDGVKSGFKRKDVSSFISVATETNVPQISKSGGKLPDQQTLNPQNFIKSTMVGTFSRSATAGGKPLVEEGDFVAVGQKVGVVEAMKVMKEVVSTVSGKIKKVLITDNHPVEYGQPLFELEPQAAVTETPADSNKKE